MTAPAFSSADVQAAFEAFPPSSREVLLTLRGWIFAIAEEREEVGQIVEELKWGQPSYATRPKTGCPLRLGISKTGETCALYVPCQTRVISDLRAHYDGLEPTGISFEGTRAMHFDPGQSLPEAELRHAITMALTYYARK